MSRDAKRRLAAAIRRRDLARADVLRLNAAVAAACAALPGLHVDERHRFAPGQREAISALVAEAQAASDRLVLASSDAVNLRSLTT